MAGAGGLEGGRPLPVEGAEGAAAQACSEIVCGALPACRVASAFCCALCWHECSSLCRRLCTAMGSSRRFAVSSIWGIGQNRSCHGRSIELLDDSLLQGAISHFSITQLTRYVISWRLIFFPGSTFRPLDVCISLISLRRENNAHYNNTVQERFAAEHCYWLQGIDISHRKKICSTPDI